MCSIIQLPLYVISLSHFLTKTELHLCSWKRFISCIKRVAANSLVSGMCSSITPEIIMSQHVQLGQTFRRRFTVFFGRLPLAPQTISSHTYGMALVYVACKPSNNNGLSISVSGVCTVCTSVLQQQYHRIGSRY